MRKVVAIGETVLDILFQNQQPMASVPGGSCFNSIISIGRTGTPCQFVGYTGGDVVGQQTVDYLTANGVSTDFFELRPNEKSAISLAYLNEQGDANYVFYKEPPHAEADAPTPDMQSGDVMLFGSYYAICQGTRPQVETLLRKAVEAHSIVYYDLNFRRPHKHEFDRLLPAILSNFKASTIVRGSADDFEIMYGQRDARRIYDEHIAAYCPIFICTDGPGLITVCTPTDTQKFPVSSVETVSTVGAGDSFNAGFIYALLRDGIQAADLPHLTAAQWQSLVTTGQRFAADVCKSSTNSISPAFAAGL